VDRLRRKGEIAGLGQGDEGAHLAQGGIHKKT